MSRRSYVVVLASILCAAAVSTAQVGKSSLQKASPVTEQIELVPVKDIHTYSHPDEARVVHVDLSLAVDFHNQVLQGSTILTVQRSPKAAMAPVVLDTEKLTIKTVEVAN